MSKSRRGGFGGMFWIVAGVVGLFLVARSGRPSEPRPSEPVAADTRTLGTTIDYTKALSTIAVLSLPLLGTVIVGIRGLRWAGVALPAVSLPRRKRREKGEEKPDGDGLAEVMGRVDEMFLGHDAKTGVAVYAPRATVASAAVGGESGAAKSTWALQLIMDRFEAGARVVVIDPDAKNAEFGLGARLGPLTKFLVGGKVAQTPAEIHAALDTVEADFEAQQNGGEVFETLVVIDEWMILLLNKELKVRLQRIVSRLAVQGRKWGMSVFLLAQNWKDGTSGMIRDMLVTRVLFRMAKNQALLCAKKGGFVPVDTPALTTGEFYWISPDAAGGLRVKGTNPTREQVEALAVRLAEKRPVPVLVAAGSENGERPTAALRIVSDDER